MAIMKTVSELFSALGRANIRQRAGHGHQVLSRAANDNLMPAHWYFDIKRLCDERGIPCPDHLFRRHHASAVDLREREPAAK